MTLALEIEKEKKQSWEAGKAEMAEMNIIGMLKENISVEVISRITNYSIEAITKIGKKHMLL